MKAAKNIAIQKQAICNLLKYETVKHPMINETGLRND